MNIEKQNPLPIKTRGRDYIYIRSLKIYPFGFTNRYNYILRILTSKAYVVKDKHPNSPLLSKIDELPKTAV